jgi:uncharacterized membrane-anchored protein
MRRSAALLVAFVGAADPVEDGAFDSDPEAVVLTVASVVVAAATLVVDRALLRGVEVDDGYWVARPHQTVCWLLYSFTRESLGQLSKHLGYT